MRKQRMGIVRAKLDIGNYRQLLKAADEVAKVTKNPDLFFLLAEKITRGRNSVSLAETAIAKLIEAKNEQ